MKKTDTVAVCSRSFSANEYLRSKLCERYENVKFNERGERLAEDNLVDFLRGCKKAIVGLETVDHDLLNRLPDLKVISKYGVGLDNVDIEAAQRFGVQIGWTPGVNRRSVAEWVIAVAIVLLRKANEANSEAIKGIWRPRLGALLSGKTFGIVGCGAIGKDVVQLLQPFGCELLVYDIREYPEFFERYHIKCVLLSELLQQSDIVTIHLPFNKSTENMLSHDVLRQMKRGGVLLNAARGGIVDEAALRALLIEGSIGAAGFDVFQEEPPTDLELLSLPNFFVTPHIGGSAIEAVIAMGEAAINGLDSAVDASVIS